MAYDWKTDLPGVFSRHADRCPVREGGQCTCSPLGFRASVQDWNVDRRSVSPVYENLVGALSWRTDQIMSENSSQGVAHDSGNLSVLIDEFVQAVGNGQGGPQNPPENARALRGVLSYVESELGTMPIHDVRRRHIQALLNQLRDTGVAPARIHSVVDALHALYAYAIQRELVDFSPVVELQVPEAGETGQSAPPRPPVLAPPPPTQSAPYSQNGSAGEPWTVPPPPTPPPLDDPWTPPPYTPPASPQPTSTGVPPPYTPPTSPQPTSTGVPPAADPYAPPSQDGTTNPPWATQQPTPPPTPPPLGDPWTPPPYAPPPYSQPTFSGAPPPTNPYAAPPYPTGGYGAPYPNTPPPWVTGYGQQGDAPQPTGPLSNLFGMAPTMAPDPASQANYDATMQERWLWWTVRIIVIVFVLIALVLVAESV